jgi:hypothetical protein
LPQHDALGIILTIVSSHPCQVKYTPNRNRNRNRDNESHPRRSKVITS